VQQVSSSYSIERNGTKPRRMATNKVGQVEGVTRNAREYVQGRNRDEVATSSNCHSEYISNPVLNWITNVLRKQYSQEVMTGHATM
jgi:hypothetical protein